MKKLFSALMSSRKGETRAESLRRLRLETLEDRQMLDAAGVMLDSVQCLEVEAAAVQPRDIVTVTIAEDVVDHSDDFNPDGSPNRISLREAFDYVDPNFSDYTTIAIAESVVDPLVLNSEIVLTTGAVILSGQDTTTITTAENVRAFNVGTGFDLTLNNLTFDSCGGAIEGGAIYNDGTLLASGVTFSNNDATKGGAIYSNGDLSVYDCQFVDNGRALTTTYGGALYLGVACQSLFEDCVFNGNGSRVAGVDYEGKDCNAGFSVRGGAIYNAGTIVGLTSTEFVGNCGFYGGAIYTKGEAIAQDDVTWSNNEAYLGGAIYVHAEGEVKVENVEFLANNARFSDEVAIDGAVRRYGSGGAVYVSSNSNFHGVFQVKDATFTNNKAPKYGGAIANYGHMHTSYSTFEGNSAAIGGAVCNASRYHSLSDYFKQNQAIVPNSKFIAEGYDWLFAEGGNGGAIYSANNDTTGEIAELTIFGDDYFESNQASRSGGAVNVVSGDLDFVYNAGDKIVFTYNLSLCGMGGAIVLANGIDNIEFINEDDVDPSEVFVFDGNYAWYAPTIGVNAKTGEHMRRMVDEFGFDYYNLSPDQVDTFSLYDAELTNDKLTYEYMAELCHWLSPNGTITLQYDGEGSTGEYTIRPGEEVRLSQLGVPTTSDGVVVPGSYKIEFYYGDPDSDPSLEPESKTAFELIVGVSNTDDRVLMRRIEILGYDNFDLVPMTGFSFVTYDNPVEAVKVDWGDGSPWWVSQVESYSTNIYHMFPDKIDWDPESGEPNPNVYTVEADFALMTKEKKHIVVTFEYYAHAGSKEWHVRPGTTRTYYAGDNALLDSAFEDPDLFDI